MTGPSVCCSVFLACVLLLISGIGFWVLIDDCPLGVLQCRNVFLAPLLLPMGGMGLVLIAG